MFRDQSVRVSFSAVSPLILERALQRAFLQRNDFTSFPVSLPLPLSRAHDTTFDIQEEAPASRATAQWPMSPSMPGSFAYQA